MAQKEGIIVDVVAFHKFSDDVNDEDSKPVHKCIRKQKLQLVYGDDEKSLEEIKRNRRMFEVWKRLDKHGGARQVHSKDKKTEIDNNRGFVNGVQLKSDDTHIIATALVDKKARILFSTQAGDTNLHKDFTNRQIINPKGNIYKHNKHKHLLPQ